MKTLAHFPPVLAILVVIIGSFAVANIDEKIADEVEQQSEEKVATEPAEKPEKFNAEDELKKDLQKLQGKWERTPIDIQGFVGKRQEKVIKGNVETLTRYDLDNNVERTHSVEFRLELSGDVKLFTFAPKGHLNDKDFESSYVYNLNGDVF